MNKSLFAVLLVCAFAGLAYAGGDRNMANVRNSASAPNNDKEQDETEQAVQLLKVLQSLKEMEDEQVNVQQQQSDQRPRNIVKSQWFRKALGIAHGLLGRK